MLDKYINMEFMPDTLVLKIVENDTVLNKPDTTVYVLYDTREEKYIIRGKRYETESKPSCSYAFDCDFAHQLAHFIEFLIDSENDVSYILYNYDNLPENSNDIDFDFLLKYDSRVYEISGYDNQKLRRKELVKYLRMLRDIYNNY